MQLTCKICNVPNVLDSHFWKEHRVKLEDYIYAHEPRRDLLTNEQIPFKNRKQYFLSYFTGRKNLNAFIKTAEKTRIISYLKESLKAQAAIRLWKYIPTEVELISHVNPKISTIQKFLDYYSYCEHELGLIPRFSQPFLDCFDQLEKEKDIEIIIDTREKLPCVFQNSIVETLNVGDYCVNQSGKLFFVDRKTLQDAIGTFSSDIERFEREVIRAKDSGGYLFILVESSLRDCLSFDYNLKLKRISGGKMRVTPDYVFSNIRDLIKKYTNLQFLFVPADEFSSYLKMILFNAERLSQCDLQANYNAKNL